MPNLPIFFSHFVAVSPLKTFNKWRWDLGRPLPLIKWKEYAMNVQPTQKLQYLMKVTQDIFLCG